MILDDFIINFSKSYPNTFNDHPKSLWNYNKYGLVNWRHIKKTSRQDLSKRAQELRLLPDGTAIVDYFITVVMNKYKDRIDSITSSTRESEGTIQSITDIAEARKEIVTYVQPYLVVILKETDLVSITERFESIYSSRSWDSGSTSGKSYGQRETDEAENRRLSFAGAVRMACRGNYKSKRQ
ncbi:MAG: hypothetical protein KKB31_06260, partial [Nanoarchaeota archaeon]|nr:hypothetical protein [Nanoarchaeota archaeon]